MLTPCIHLAIKVLARLLTVSNSFSILNISRENTVHGRADRTRWARQHTYARVPYGRAWLSVPRIKSNVLEYLGREMPNEVA